MQIALAGFNLAYIGRIGNRKVTKEMSKKNRPLINIENYKEGMKMQEHYYNKWKKICNDQQLAKTYYKKIKEEILNE